MTRRNRFLVLLLIASFFGATAWGLKSIDVKTIVNPGDLVLSINLGQLEGSQRKAYITLSRTVFTSNWFNFGLHSSMHNLSVDAALPAVAIPPKGVTRQQVLAALLVFMDYHGLLIPKLELRLLNRNWPERLFSLLFSPRITTPFPNETSSREDFFFSTENNNKFLASIHRRDEKIFICLDVPPKNQTMNPPSKGGFLLALIAEDGGIALSEFIARSEPVSLEINFPDDFKYVPEFFPGPYVFLAYLDGEMIMNAKAYADSERWLSYLTTR